MKIVNVFCLFVFFVLMEGGLGADYGSITMREGLISRWMADL